jgi:phosphoribosylformylglycinamidine synthase
LLISAIGVVEDVNRAISMDLKEAGDLIYLIGDFSPGQNLVPDVPSSTLQVYRALHQASTRELVRSAHDLSDGGLAVAAAEMCIGGRLGMELAIDESVLFAEVNGCLLVEVSPGNAAHFESVFTNLLFRNIGIVTQEPALNILESTSISVFDLIHAFNHPKHS